MKAVLYSGGQTDENRRLHDALSQLVPHSGFRSLTYISNGEDGASPFFEAAKRRYERFGFSRFHLLHPDRPPTRSERQEALGSDVLYLAGGNTFYSLYHLRKSGLLSDLQSFSKRGGILAGLSAGAIILTPHIGLAGYPEFDRDENEVGLRRLKALGLTSFEFFPHYRNMGLLNRALEHYSAQSRFPIIATRDGGGIVLDGNETRWIGESLLFVQGKRHRIMG